MPCQVAVKKDACIVGQAQYAKEIIPTSIGLRTSMQVDQQTQPIEQKINRQKLITCAPNFYCAKFQ